MKKHLILIVLIACCFIGFRNPDPEVFNTHKIYWAGIDFSQVKCIGPQGFSEPYQIKYKYFRDWNDLILEENRKFDIQRFYEKSGLIYDLSVVYRRNDIPEVEDLVTTDTYSFEEGQLEEIVADYELEKGNEGVGLVYVVESLNKNTETAKIHVVFFDLASKEILWKRVYFSRPKGFGFRNYWAGAIYDTMKASSKDFEQAAKHARRAARRTK